MKALPKSRLLRFVEQAFHLLTYLAAVSARKVSIQ